MENKTRTFGGKEDSKFWADKPIQTNHPKKLNWWHIHWFNIPYNIIHSSPCGTFKEEMPFRNYKCRCGKIK